MSKFDTNSKATSSTRTTGSKARTPQKKSTGGTLLGVFIGLVIGIVIAFGVVLYLNKSTLPFQSKGEAPAKTDKPAAPAGAGSAAGPAPLPGKPGDKVNDKQRFEFYGILEGKKPATPGAAPAPTAAPATAPAAAPAVAAPETKAVSGEVFFLQAGAFQKPADADNLKAKLALSGLEASVQEVSIPEKGTMHRVRVGPFRTPEDMNRVRTQLSQAGVQASVIKQKE